MPDAASPPTSAMPAASAGDKLIGRENLGSPHSGQRTSLTPGDLMARSMGHYGKEAETAPPLLGPDTNPAASQPSGPSPAASIRGGTGVMRRRISKGGLGGPTSPGVF